MRADRPQVKQDRAVRTRRTILEAAAMVFEDRGYDNAKLSDIVRLAEVTKGALYFHFASKEDLAQAVIDAQVSTHEPFTPQEFRAQEFVDIGMIFSHRLRHDVLMRGSARLTLEQSGRGLDRVAPYQGWIDLHAALMVEAKECGELLPHVDPAQPARLVVGSFAGLNVMSQTLGLDLDREVSALYTSVMPSLVFPAVAARLDTAPGRGARALHGPNGKRACDCSAGRADGWAPERVAERVAPQAVESQVGAPAESFAAG
ncbi:TetR/AcrR family transcriptional regulator [Streptomyces sp. NBC_01351]|uniref:ScbR family autoregulator-binding transcription factor n=1 Tax=Streptomyces sp. NBC_01351 TaxID=2903833 RepID=UPI002E32B642|nr:ScbR family autoregulator-binding transcription factor [Streptomyces sp. NBC_01351]